MERNVLLFLFSNRLLSLWLFMFSWFYSLSSKTLRGFKKKISYDNCLPSPISSFLSQGYGLMGYEAVWLFFVYINSLLIAQILQRPTTAQLVSKRLWNVEENTQSWTKLRYQTGTILERMKKTTRNVTGEHSVILYRENKSSKRTCTTAFKT
jgi:hypothetical protein